VVGHDEAGQRGSRGKPNRRRVAPDEPRGTGRRRLEEVPGSRAGAPAGKPGATPGRFYAGLLTEAELADLAGAGERGIEDEVALLRVLARRAVDAGDQKQALKVVRALVAAIKVQDGLADGVAKELDRTLSAVLDELGQELGVPL
jgi:hypothetical protein